MALFGDPSGHLPDCAGIASFASIQLSSSIAVHPSATVFASAAEPSPRSTWRNASIAADARLFKNLDTKRDERAPRHFGH
jgi:hypothetical protein